METSSIDQLGDEIAELSAHLDVATARLLDLIREFDAREGWNTGFRSCAAWLSWRVGLDLGATRERVRVARALPALPRLAQALARGELSYAKVRALTRVATPETEERLLTVARIGTACHVERIVRGWRRVDRYAEARETAQRHKSRALHVYQDEDGMWIIRGRLAPEVGAVLVQGLDAGREALYQQRRALNVDSTREAGFIPQDVSEETPSMEHQRADALALVAETALHHGIDPGAPGERYQVVIHVDAPVLADPDQPGQSVLDDGTHVSAETARRLACDASRVAMQHARDGRVVEVAARTRTIPPALGVRSNIETTAVDSRAVACASARVITFGIGHTEGRRRSPISLCSVAGITVRCTRRDIRSSGNPMASCNSGVLTGGFYRRPRRHRRWARMS
jgi:Domain of unknown function (DUF222)